MLFNSLQFVGFFLIFCLLYFSLPYRYRLVLLLMANYFFYMCWKFKYVFLLLATTLVDYFCARQMNRYQDDRIRRRFVWVSLAQNLGVLFTFKYFNFFIGTAHQVMTALSIPIELPHLQLILPVAISFFTFQSVAYVLDVYWRKVPAQTNVFYFLLYTSFFPQLVSGPIERPKHFMPQFYVDHQFDGPRVASGLRLMLWGFFKKIVVADRLAVYVNTVYNNADLHSGATLLVATYFFAFQIYCDFSGYTDIAIGSARVLGFDLLRNFQRPYFSRSIPEFWRRWHISLSTWFRDYVYIPLGGNRVTAGRAYANLAIVFLVSGLWHGANWTFVIWGGLHGFYMVVSRMTKGLRDRLTAFLHVPPVMRSAAAMLITFNLANIAWVYFLARDMSTANFIVKKIFSADYRRLFVPAMDQFVYGLAAIGLLLIVDGLQERRSVAAWLDKRPMALRWAVYLTISVLILLMGVFNGGQFIYFQF